MSFDIREAWDAQYKLNKIKMRRMKVDEMKYYGGFSVGRDKSIFREELEQLEKVYQEVIDHSKEELERVTPVLISYMKAFVEHYEAIDKVSCKLEDLNYKRADINCKECEEEDDQEED